MNPIPGSYWHALLASGLCRAAEPPVDRLVVGGDAAYPPFEWLDEDGQPRGFNVELIRLLTAQPGVQVNSGWATGPIRWPRWMPAKSMWCRCLSSDERRQRYRFTNIYVYQTHALFGLPDQAPLDGVDRLADSSLVVEADSHAQNELRKRFPDVQPALTANTRQALEWWPKVTPTTHCWPLRLRRN